MEDSVFQMQQAARERVRQAHERSRRIIEQNEHRPIRDPLPQKPAPTPLPTAEPPGGENEQLLLLLLAFFLYKNGASLEVLLALLYLAL